MTDTVHNRADVMALTLRNAIGVVAGVVEALELEAQEPPVSSRTLNPEIIERLKSALAHKGRGFVRVGVDVADVEDILAHHAAPRSLPPIALSPTSDKTLFLPSETANG